MPQTREGGIKAAKTNKKRHGADFYVKIGKLGGTKSRGGGFAYDKELAREAGKKGGSVSRRTAIQKGRAEILETAKAHKTWKERIGL